MDPYKGANRQTILDIHKLQEREAKRDVARAAVGVGVVAAATLIPDIHAKAATLTADTPPTDVFKEVADYAGENWWWLVPTVAGTDGLIDAGLTPPAAGQPNGVREFAFRAIEKAGAETFEMFTVLFAAKQVADTPNMNPILSIIGHVVVPVGGVYAALPDVVAGWLHDNVISPAATYSARAVSAAANGAANIVTSWSARAAKKQ